MLRRWMKKIGSQNPSKKSRYELWKKQGFCPPDISIEDRLEKLKSKNG